MQKLSFIDIKKLNNFELYQTLKIHGLNIGPVEKSTRSIYEKRLFKKQICLNESSNNFFSIIFILRKSKNIIWIYLETSDYDEDDGITDLSNETNYEDEEITDLSNETNDEDEVQFNGNDDPNDEIFDQNIETFEEDGSFNDFWQYQYQCYINAKKVKRRKRIIKVVWAVFSCIGLCIGLCIVIHLLFLNDNYENY